MKLLSISVKNFRSIHEEMTLQVKAIGSKTCYILLGINESGKSNMLDAIALLNEIESIDYEDDCNKIAQEDEEEIEITYAFEPESDTEIRSALVSMGVDKALADKVKVKLVERKIAMGPDGERVDYYFITLKQEKTFVKLLEKYLVVSGAIITRAPGSEEHDGDGIVSNLLTVERLEDYMQDNLFDVLEAMLPEVIFWKPVEDKYLINKPIDLNAFKEDVDSSIPLRNCFRIAGIATPEKIKARIEAIAGKPGKTAELVQKLGESVTKHINEKWGEHHISVKFAIDTGQLSFLVEDNDDTLPKYAVQQRSDGFKHFVSLLLNVSAENKAKVLANKVVLLDEPEIHLHPSGQKYLRDELLEIGKNNLVVYATHSIYMVDTKNIDRHFSVKKTKGKTVCTQIEKDNPYREEVLYNALGTSVLELIEPNVLIFEGKTDRDIFELYLKKLKTDLAPPKVSLISADGCKNIRRYTKFFNIKLVKGYVLTDSDKDGVEEKNEVMKEPGYSVDNTFEINDLYDTKIDATLEDLFGKGYLIKAVKDHYDLDIELDARKPLVAQVKEQLVALRKPYNEEEKRVLRNYFFEQIAKLDKDALRKEKYFEVAKALCSKIKV